MSFDIVREEINTDKYFLVEYYINTTKTLYDAAWNIAVGQSVGNPNVRSLWETKELFEKYSALIMNRKGLRTKNIGYVTIAFPIANIDWVDDGISQLLCTIMGGQLDIDTIKECRVCDIWFPKEVTKQFHYNEIGINGIRKITNRYNKPLLGGIIKPKTGLTKEQLLDMVKQLVDGGVDFIKEDEIMANPAFCKLTDRVPYIQNYLHDKNIIYCYCINADPHAVLKRAQFVSNEGGNGVHVNLWSGLGVYNSIRKLNTGLFIHFQKSGDQIFTNVKHDFSIDWKVICRLAGLMGVDSIHAGMYGGYHSDNEEYLLDVLKILQSDNVLPVLSCGMHPGLVDIIREKFGNDWMANVGGAIHGHPDGTLAGTYAMRQAIDGDHHIEYDRAIEKWGKLDV